MVKFKYYHTGSTFNSSNLSNDDIAFVEATGSLWTHGHEYKLTDTVTDIQDHVKVNGTAFQNTGDGYINITGANVIRIEQPSFSQEVVVDGGLITEEWFWSPSIRIGLATQSNTIGSYGDSSAQTPSFGSTFKVPYITTNAQGIVTAISDHTVTLPTPTTYESKQAANGGTAESLVTTGEKYTWNNKQDALSFITAPSSNNKVATASDIPTTLPASDVYSWAKASSKPSYSYSEISNTPSSLPASDVYSWAKASSKPTYTLSEVGATTSVSAISSNTSSTCSITGSGNAGKIQTIIYTNSTSSDLTVTVPTTYTTPDGAAIELTCPGGGYCEVSYLNISGTIYARGI